MMSLYMFMCIYVACDLNIFTDGLKRNIMRILGIVIWKIFLFLCLKMFKKHI